MIKVERKYDSESFIMKNEIYDSKRENEFKVSIFGLVVFKRNEHHFADFGKDKNNGIGFKKEA